MRLSWIESKKLSRTHVWYQVMHLQKALQQAHPSFRRFAQNHIACILDVSSSWYLHPAFYLLLFCCQILRFMPLRLFWGILWILDLEHLFCCENLWILDHKVCSVVRYPRSWILNLRSMLGFWDPGSWCFVFRRERSWITDFCLLVGSWGSRNLTEWFCLEIL